MLNETILTMIIKNKITIPNRVQVPPVNEIDLKKLSINSRNMETF